jgi:peptidoglycan/LPS O-acetylase OafA/YrhL
LQLGHSAKLNIPSLDIARFSAASMVMAYHLAAVSWTIPETITGQIFQQAATYPEVFPLTWFGFVGGVEPAAFIMACRKHIASL